MAAQAGRWLARQWQSPASQQTDGVWQAQFDKAMTVGMGERPTSPGRTDGRQSHRSGCWKLVLGLPLLLLFLAG